MVRPGRLRAVLLPIWVPGRDVVASYAGEIEVSSIPIRNRYYVPALSAGSIGRAMATAAFSAIPLPGRGMRALERPQDAPDMASGYIHGLDAFQRAYGTL
jgi:hypothetical protein